MIDRRTIIDILLGFHCDYYGLHGDIADAILSTVAQATATIPASNDPDTNSSPSDAGAMTRPLK